jgi:hypothetical protein
MSTRPLFRVSPSGSVNFSHPEMPFEPALPIMVASGLETSLFDPNVQMTGSHRPLWTKNDRSRGQVRIDIGNGK